MSRLLTSHHPRFRQDGLFFYALLGVVALGERVARFIGEGDEPSSAPAAREPAAVTAPELDPVLFCLLGMSSVRQRVLAMIGDWAAQGTPPAPRAPERAMPVDFLK